MPTFKEICENVLEEANGRPRTLSSTDLGKDSDGNYYVTDPTERNIIRWVNELYLLKQQRCVDWEFMHKRGAFLVTKADVETYTRKRIRDLGVNSLYAVKEGTTAKVPVYQTLYEDWVERERWGEETKGYPLEIIRSPDEKWILDPIPTGVWTLYGDWWVWPEKFTESCEEPLWESEYHEVLKWEALQLFAAEFASEGAGAILQARVKQMLPLVQAAFHRRYQPFVIGAAAFV